MSGWLSSKIINRPSTHKWLRPAMNWYADRMGHRQLGLRIEDLLPEESEVMQLALKRLPPKEAYDRVFRLRRAFQLSLSHQILPPEQWTPREEDVDYLSRIVEEIEAEIKERQDLDSIVVKKKKKEEPAAPSSSSSSSH